MSAVLSGGLRSTFSNGAIGYFEPYAFGIAYKQAGSDNDNRLELYLGRTDTDPAELSVRHNGNNTGAIIQARNAGDTDGMFLSFQYDSYPFVRWGNAGPYLIKDAAGVLVMRNYGTPGEAQRFRVANTYTPGGALEYVEVGFSSNRAKVRAIGSGGGTQRPLDFDASAIQLQTGGTARWEVDANGYLKSNSGTYPLKTTATTVANLPAAATAGAGARAFVSDANATTFASVVAGGGANGVPVYCDGTDWRIG